VIAVWASDFNLVEFSSVPFYGHRLTYSMAGSHRSRGMLIHGVASGLLWRLPYSSPSLAYVMRSCSLKNPSVADTYRYLLFSLTASHHETDLDWLNILHIAILYCLKQGFESAVLIG